MNALVWIDNPSVSAFMYNPDCGRSASKRAVPVTASRSPAKTQKIHCAGSLSPRSALVEDISPGSSLRESYCKG